MLFVVIFVSWNYEIVEVEGFLVGWIGWMILNCFEFLIWLVVVDGSFFN